MGAEGQLVEMKRATKAKKMHTNIEEAEIKAIGERIKDVRARAGLTQEAFGKALKTSSGYICEIEKGASLPGSLFILRLLRTFDFVDANFVFGTKSAEDRLAAIERELAGLRDHITRGSASCNNAGTDFATISTKAKQ